MTEETDRERLDDGAWVVRGGIPTAAQLRRGSKQHGTVFGFSVQAANEASIEALALAGGFPNSRIGVTTVRALHDLGYSVVRTRGNGRHATVVLDPAALTDAALEDLAALFNVMPNPHPRPRP